MPNLIAISQRLNIYICIIGFLLLGGCSSTSVLAPSKDTTEKEPVLNTRPSSTVGKIPLEDELDFALAFVDSIDERALAESKTPALPEIDTKRIREPVRGKPIMVPGTMVRVALHKNVNRITVYSLGTVNVYAGRKSRTASCRGRIAVSNPRKKRKKLSVILDAAKLGKLEAFLPCTLLAKSDENYFELKDQSYRGSIILVAGRNGTFTVVNYCGVEDYLRGVVPLEIGKRSKEEFEAVKAQAVAARTYTYKKILKKYNSSYDLVATVADQVYGGVNVEYPLSDRAIQLTKGIVLAYGDSLIYSYYHSTCGGVTANIEDVWNKAPAPYLCSIKDVDKNGGAYCSISKYYTWQESWKTSTLASILWRFTDKNSPNHFHIKGKIKKIVIAERFSCGRISVCRVASSLGIYEYGGDRIRFVFRRNLKEYPILRSSSFEVLNVDSKEVLLKGRGYGHGVGMCQMGAIGRARAGQSFGEILDAYYTGSYVAAVNVKKSRGKIAYE